MPMDEEQKKCCGIGALGLVAILVSVVMMAIGGINIDIENSNLKNVDVVSTCKVEEKLPYYLLVAGAINIILIALRFVFQVSYLHFLKKKIQFFQEIIFLKLPLAIY